MRDAYDDDVTSIDKLAKWLCDVTAEGAVRVELRHLATSGRVREWRVSEHASGDTSALATEIQHAVDSDGRYAPRGRGVYALLAYRAAPGPYFARCYVEAHEAFEEEPERGTNEAVVIQMMRHSEVSARLALGHTNEVVAHYQALLNTAHQRIRALEGREQEVTRIWESLTAQLTEREIALIKARTADKKSDFLREKLDLLLPVAMQKLLGGGGGKGGAPVMGEELIRQLLRSIRPEQMNAILGLLAPEQLAIFAEVYGAYGEQEMEREKKRQEREAAATKEALGDDGGDGDDGGAGAPGKKKAA